jgi:hypothetical protein
MWLISASSRSNMVFHSSAKTKIEAQVIDGQ